MTEYRFFDAGTVPTVSTFAFHAERERAPHLEQDAHRARLVRTAELVTALTPDSVVDLGCGDGGLLQLLKYAGIPAWGYDFQPSNVAGWVDRDVTATARDVLHPGADVSWGELAVCTEVLEHIADPHGVVEWIARNARFLVVSSPCDIDTPESHAVEHAWGWDADGYRALVSKDWRLLTYERVEWSQIVVGQSRYAS